MPFERPHRPKRRPAAVRKPKTARSDGLQRLQKVLAAAGLGSRRQCEELITAGRVDVDRRVVTELGTRVDPAKQAIRVDGVALHTARLEYFAVNKPSGVLCTNRDPSGRTRVVDLIDAKHARLFTIGRLDLHSEGLILVTNDGDLANRLTHPRYGVSKTYRVVVAGNPTREVLDKLEQGIHLAEGFARAERMQIKSHHKESTVLEMVLREGKNREIRRLLARVGHKVLRLTRIAVGPVRLGSLPTGAVRRLMPDEVRALQREGAAGGC
jgi:23S rRNA pseudouridine2605 synthase